MPEGPDFPLKPLLKSCASSPVCHSMPALASCIGRFRETLNNIEPVDRRASVRGLKILLGLGRILQWFALSLNLLNNIVSLMCF